MNFLHRILNMFSYDLAIDLGTANTLVHVKGEGIVVDEPSVVAYNLADGSRKVLAVGNEAKLMQGRTPKSIEVIRPLRYGVIADFQVAEDMIKYFIRKVHHRRTLAKPRILVCVPHGATAVEKRAIRQSVLSAGARTAGLIPEPIAAALGVGINYNTPYGAMIVDIGGGTTEVAVLSLGDIVYANSIRIGGDAMDDALVGYVLENCNIHIGYSTAEKIKKTIGTAKLPKDGEGKTSKFYGRTNEGGHPKEIHISQRMVAEALRNPIEQIRRAVAVALQMTPPDLSSDLFETGMIMTGGGAMLQDFDKVLRERTHLAVTVAEEPLKCVALGTGIALNSEQSLHPLIDYHS